MYCGWLVIELVFVVGFIVETRGRTLEETAALFDGEQQPQNLMHMGGEAATVTMSRGRLDLITRDRKEKILPLDSMEMHTRRPSPNEQEHRSQEIEMQERYLYRVDSESDSIIQLE